MVKDLDHSAGCDDSDQNSAASIIPDTQIKHHESRSGPVLPPHSAPFFDSQTRVSRCDRSTWAFGPAASRRVPSWPCLPLMGSFAAIRTTVIPIPAVDPIRGTEALTIDEISEAGETPAGISAPAGAALVHAVTIPKVAAGIQIRVATSSHVEVSVDLPAVLVDLPVASVVDLGPQEDSGAALALQEVLALGAATTENPGPLHFSTGSTETATDGSMVKKCRVAVPSRASWIAPGFAKEPAATISPAASIACAKNPAAKEVTTEVEVRLQAATHRRRRSE
jgi:hypothetical protein